MAKSFDSRKIQRKETESTTEVSANYFIKMTPPPGTMSPQPEINKRKSLIGEISFFITLT